MTSSIHFVGKNKEFLNTRFGAYVYETEIDDPADWLTVLPGLVDYEIMHDYVISIKD